jgi:hypothetical protein
MNDSVGQLFIKHAFLFFNKKDKQILYSLSEQYKALKIIQEEELIWAKAQRYIDKQKNKMPFAHKQQIRLTQLSTQWFQA